MTVPSISEDSKSVPVGAPEKVTLDTAIMQSAGVTKIVVQDITLDWRHNIIHIRVGEIGEMGRSLKIVEYTGLEARKMLMGLNKADLVAKSFNKRIMEKLQKDGFLGSGKIN
jgi:hypothetical protein